MDGTINELLGKIRYDKIGEVKEAAGRAGWEAADEPAIRGMGLDPDSDETLDNTMKSAAGDYIRHRREFDAAHGGVRGDYGGIGRIIPNPYPSRPKDFVEEGPQLTYPERQWEDAGLPADGPYGPVNFLVYLKQGGSSDRVASELEKMADDITIKHCIEIFPEILVAETSKETYESLFGASLSYVRRTINNINRGPYEVEEWVQHNRSVIPEQYRDLISDVRIEQKMYLTD